MLYDGRKACGSIYGWWGLLADGKWVEGGVDSYGVGVDECACCRGVGWGACPWVLVGVTRRSFRSPYSIGRLEKLHTRFLNPTVPAAENQNQEK